jgi:glutathione S-transferase
MKLIGTHASPYTRKVRVVALEKKIDLPFEIDNPWAADSRVPEVNPAGRVPVLVLEDGSTLYDSRVIAEYLDLVSPLGHLIPASGRDRIEVKRWEALADETLGSAVLVRLERNRDAALQSADWIARQLDKVKAGLDTIDRQIGESGWCFGNAITLADIAVGCTVLWLEFRFAETDWRGGRPALDRLVTRLAARPSFAQTLPQA